MNKPLFLLILRTTPLSRSRLYNSTFRERGREPISGSLQLKRHITDVTIHVFLGCDTVRMEYNVECCPVSRTSPHLAQHHEIECNIISNVIEHIWDIYTTYYRPFPDKIKLPMCWNKRILVICYEGGMKHKSRNNLPNFAPLYKCFQWYVLDL